MVTCVLLIQTKSMKLYEACLTLLQVYSKNNQSRKRSDATAEEDQYQDLLLIMELLTNLLSKEFIDFSDTGEVFKKIYLCIFPLKKKTSLKFELDQVAVRSRWCVSKSRPGNTSIQSNSIRCRCRSLWCQYSSSAHVSGPAQGKT